MIETFLVRAPRRVAVRADACVRACARRPADPARPCREGATRGRRRRRDRRGVQDPTGRSAEGPALLPAARGRRSRSGSGRSFGLGRDQRASRPLARVADRAARRDRVERRARCTGRTGSSSRATCRRSPRDSWSRSRPMRSTRSSSASLRRPERTRAPIDKTSCRRFLVAERGRQPIGGPYLGATPKMASATAASAA